jgi:hypothetical protein
MKKAILSWLVLSVLFSSSVFAADGYKEIQCSTNPVFWENQCTQCFEGGVVEEWKDIWLLSDLWSNGTSKAMYMLKEENELTDAVKMISLNWAAWSYEPTKEWFWEYTEALDKLEDSGFYKLDAWQSVDWIQSKLGYSIKLNKSAEAWKEIGLLKYVINIHLDDWAWNPSDWTTSHSECVLFKSAGKSDIVPPKKEQPKKLPQTWPQEVLLLLLSLILAGSVFYFSKKRV